MSDRLEAGKDRLDDPSNAEDLVLWIAELETTGADATRRQEAADRIRDHYDELRPQFVKWLKGEIRRARERGLVAEDEDDAEVVAWLAFSEQVDAHRRWLKGLHDRLRHEQPARHSADILREIGFRRPAFFAYAQRKAFEKLGLRNPRREAPVPESPDDFLDQIPDDSGIVESHEPLPDAPVQYAQFFDLLRGFGASMLEGRAALRKALDLRLAVYLALVDSSHPNHERLKACWAGATPTPEGPSVNDSIAGADVRRRVAAVFEFSELFELANELWVASGERPLSRTNFYKDTERLKALFSEWILGEAAVRTLVEVPLYGTERALKGRDWMAGPRQRRADALATQLAREAGPRVLIIKGDVAVRRAVVTLALCTAGVLRGRGLRVKVRRGSPGDVLAPPVSGTTYVLVDAPRFENVEEFGAAASRLGDCRVLASGLASEWGSVAGSWTGGLVEIVRENAPGLRSTDSSDVPVDSTGSVTELVRCMEAVALADRCGVGTPARFLAAYLGYDNAAFRGEVARKVKARRGEEWRTPGDADDPGDEADFAEEVEAEVHKQLIEQITQLVSLSAGTLLLDQSDPLQVRVISVSEDFSEHLITRLGDPTGLASRYRHLVSTALARSPDHARRMLAGVERTGPRAVLRALVGELASGIRDVATERDLPARHRISWATTLRDLDALELARQVLVAGLAAYPDELRMLHLRADLLGRLGQYEEADRSFAALEAREPGNQYVLAGWADMHRNRRGGAAHEAARRLYHQALKVDTENPIARVGLATLLRREGDLAAARAALQPLLSHAPHCVHALVALSEIQLAAGETSEASRTLGAALAIDPYSVGTLVAAGTLAKGRGHRGQAARYLRRALDIDPENLHALTSLADLRIQQRGWAEAEVLIRHCREIDDETVEVQTLRAAYFLARGHSVGAREALARAEKIDQESEFVLVNKARLRNLEGDAEGARAGFRDVAARRGTGRVVALTEWARLEEAEGERDTARQLFREAHESDRSNVVTLTAWAEFEIRAGDLSAAEERLSQALTLDPQNVSALRVEAQLLDGRADASSASVLERAASLETEDAWES